MNPDLHDANAHEEIPCNIAAPTTAPMSAASSSAFTTARTVPRRAFASDHRNSTQRRSSSSSRPGRRQGYTQAPASPDPEMMARPRRRERTGDPCFRCPFRPPIEPGLMLGAGPPSQAALFWRTKSKWVTRPNMIGPCCANSTESGYGKPAIGPATRVSNSSIQQTTISTPWKTKRFAVRPRVMPAGF